MGIFSFLFKKKKVNNVEETKNAADNASSQVSITKEVTKDHQDICDFLLCYENYKKAVHDKVAIHKKYKMIEDLELKAITNQFKSSIFRW